MYYPFTKPLDELEHTDVENFCKQGVAENLYLDYKQELKGEKLSKSIASFANTNGGILLIGVHEDKTTKLPSAWDGIADTGTLSEQINAEIANVVPYPTCRFAIVPHKTKGKVFVVLVVEAGMSAPYFTVHKPIVWVRTGDITTPIGQSNRADLLSLAERGEDADAKIDTSLELAEELFNERYTRVKNSNPIKDNAFSTDVVEVLSMVNIPLVASSIIPQNPEELISQKELYEQRHDFRYDKRQLIPGMNVDLEPVRYGIVTQNRDAFNVESEKVRYMYVSKNGLLQFRNSLKDRHNQSEFHNLFMVLRTIENTLRYASTFYSHLKYSGPLRFLVVMENLDKEIPLYGTSNIMSDSQTMPIDLDEYDWKLDLSTHDLTTDKAKELLTQLYTNIYLDVGFRHLPSDAQKMIDEFQI